MHSFSIALQFQLFQNSVVVLVCFFLPRLPLVPRLACTRFRQESAQPFQSIYDAAPHSIAFLCSKLGQLDRLAGTLS